MNHEPDQGGPDDAAWPPLDLPDDVVAALRAPGTPEELSSEAQMLAAFRTTQRRRGALVRRIGVAGTAAVVVVGLSGGVAAAAYTGRLPSPLQDFAHETFRAVGVPATQPVEPAAAPAVATTAATLPATAAPTQTPTRRPSRPVPTVVTAVTTAPPTPTATPAPTAPTPTRATARPPVGAVTASSSAAVVDEGRAVTLTARAVTADGTPLRGRKLTLQARPGGAHAWTRVGRASSNASGDVSFTSRALSVTTAFRVVDHPASGPPVRSQPVTVKVKPRLTAAWTNGTLTVEASASRAGESVTVRTAGRVVTTVTLDAAGRASGGVPQTRRERTCAVTLPASRRHTGTTTTVVIPAAP